MSDVKARDVELPGVGRVPVGIFIGGAWRAAGAGTFDVLDPATGTVLASVGRASLADAEAAVRAAEGALGGFSRTSARVRADLLLAAYHAVQDRAEELATLITLEMGKPLAESRGEVAYAADFLRWFAEEAPRVSGTFRSMPDGSSRMLVTPRPVGVCVLVTPWNFPLAMATRKIAPALAAGCTAVLKPAEDTPLTSLLFAEILAGCGLPDGVVNVVTSDEPGPLVQQMLLDPAVRKLSFTGSTEVGRTLLATSSRQVLRTSMELGGNAPFIIFDDADVDVAVDSLMLAKFRNGGQACTAANRVFVQRGVHAEFMGLLATRVNDLRMGAGSDPASTLGPLIHDEAVQRTQRLVEEAVAAGGRLVTGGMADAGTGSFFPATIVDNVPGDAGLSVHEVFAPVVSVSVFDTESEVVVRANDTEFGLVAYVCTSDQDRMFRLPTELEYGMVAVNRGLVSNAAAPFGGVKHSGLGREGSHEGINEYLEYVYTALNA